MLLEVVTVPKPSLTNPPHNKGLLLRSAGLCAMPDSVSASRPENLLFTISLFLF